MLFLLSLLGVFASYSVHAATLPSYTCDVSHLVPALPENAGQGNLTLDAKVHPTLITLGVGYQLYNCTSNNWISNGADATLYYFNCPATSAAEFVSAAQALVNRSPKLFLKAAAKVIGYTPSVVGSHYFEPTPNATTGISPTFDLRRSAGGSLAENRNGFVTLKKVGSIASPDGVENVPWLKLASIKGSLAKQVWRLSTVGGAQPEGPCKDGDQVERPYAAMYWFFA